MAAALERRARASGGCLKSRGLRPPSTMPPRKTVREATRELYLAVIDDTIASAKAELADQGLEE